MKKATHDGTCQACGRVQAITENGVAKHGYIVDWGFHGTCTGSDHLPLEVDNSIAKSTIEICLNRALALDAEAEGEIVAVYLSAFGKDRDQNRSHADQFRFYTHEEFTAARHQHFWNKWEEKVANERNRLAGIAQSNRNHAGFLLGLNAERFGQDLYPRAGSEIERCKFEGFKKYADAYAKAEELKADGWKVRVNNSRDYGLNVTANRVKQGETA